MSTENVLGYRPASQKKVDRVNMNKAIEERLLRELKQQATGGVDGPVDQRWVAIAVTHLEQAFMAWNRAILQPQRLTDEEMRRILGVEI